MTPPILRPTRREILKASGTFAAVSALSGVRLPQVHAGSDNTIRVALIGCGARGGGAVENALLAKEGPTQLVAMADVFPDKLTSTLNALKNQFSTQHDVPEDRKFVGFDGYKNAIDCLKPGDVAIMTTPPAFRWVHFKYAIEKGVNVFMEKPVAVDGPTSKRMLELAEESEKKGMKVAVGLMCRHCLARKELHQRISDGQIGDIVLLRAYRQVGPTASAFSDKKPDDISEVAYQIKRFHSFLWASGGAYADFLIHNIDECCWMKNAWPVKATGAGGRHYRGNFVDQNFDTYSVEYTFADGSKLMLEGRTMTGCHQEFASYAHGTKGSAIISTSTHTPAKCRIFNSQSMTKENQTWAYGKDEPDPYQVEWDDFITAIRENKPYNEVKRGVEASIVTNMGRMACHTGQAVTFEQMVNCDHEFAPDASKLTIDGPAPVMSDAEGKYPIPKPGISKKREY